MSNAKTHRFFKHHLHHHFTHKRCPRRLPVIICCLCTPDKKYQKERIRLHLHSPVGR